MKKIMALALALVMILSLLPVNAMADDSAVTIGNHGYPWMRYEGSSLSQYLNLDIAGEVTSYQWMISSEKDGTYTEVSGQTNFEMKCDYASGHWVKCLVNGTVESKPVYIVYKPANNRAIFYITNGTVGYTLTGSSFEVCGKFGDDWKSTSKGGDYNNTWPLYAIRGKEPGENATSSVSQLASFRGYFLDSDPYTIMFEATMTDQGEYFCFGNDLSFGNTAMTSIIKNNDGIVTGIQLVDAKTQILANENSPSIVIRTPNTPDKYWLGSRIVKPFTQGTEDEYNGYDAAMSFSWINLTGGTVIPFSVSVGTVEQTGADLGEPIPTYNITLDRTNYTDSYFDFYTYDADGNEIGYIYENTTTVIPTDGCVQIWTKKEFYVAAAGATVGELTENGYGYYYRTITDFTKDTTVVVSEEPIAIHTHEMTKTPAKDATCTADGNIEYYTCSECGMTFADEKGERELTAEELVLKSEGHKMTKTTVKDANCTADGNIEYYSCSVCKKSFADEKGEKELKADELVVKSEGHKMTKTPAKAVTCTADGNIEYYTCSVCKKTFADEKGEKELTAEELVMKSEGHKVEKKPAKAPTYIADGNKEYYHCNVCDTVFADAEGKTELTASEIKDLVIPQLILVDENKAEVSEGAVDKALSESNKDEDVTLDLTHKDVIGEENVGAVTKVELPVAALETMVEKEKALTLVKEDATVTLDVKALEAIVEQAEGNTVTLVVKNVEETTLKPAQQAAVEDKKVAVTISAELICDQTGEKIVTKDGKGFGGGAVTVSIPVPDKLPEGVKAADLKVYFVDDDGTVEHLSSKLEGDKIVFTLKHFSEYVIAADASDDLIAPPTGDNSAVAMYIMLGVISAVAIVMLIAYEKKGKARYI